MRERTDTADCCINAESGNKRTVYAMAEKIWRICENASLSISGIIEWSDDTKRLVTGHFDANFGISEFFDFMSQFNDEDLIMCEFRAYSEESDNTDW